MTMTLERALDVLRVVTSRAMQGSETRDAYDCVVSHLAQSAQSVAAKDAEIDRLQAGFAKHVDRVCELQSRLAAANALLRKVYAYLDRFDPNSDVYDEVEAHLQGSGDEA